MKQGLFFRTLYNTGAQLAGRFLSGLLAFLLTLFLAKNLGGAGFGEYTKIMAYLAFFYVLADFGLNTIFLRDYRVCLSSAFGAFLGLRLAGSLILGAAAVTLLAFISRFVPGWTGTVNGVAIGAVSIVGFGVFASVSALFQMRRRYDQIAISQTVGAAAALGFLFLTYRMYLPAPEQGVLVAMAAVVVGWWASAVTGAILLKQPLFLIPVLDRRLWQRVCLSSLPLGVTLALNTVYFRADTFILATYRSSLEVGAYGLAYKFFEIAITLPTFIMNSLYPEFLVADMNETQVRRRFSSLWKVFLVLAIGMGGIIWLLAPFIARVNTDFTSSVLYLRLLLLALPFFFLSSPLMWFFVLLRRQEKLVIVYGLSLVFNITANLLLVPRFGAVAAAVTTGLTEVTVLLTGLYFMRLQRT